MYNDKTLTNKILRDEIPIGKKIKMIRLHLGLSQQNLADDTGYAHSTISRIEAGKTMPHSNALRKIRQALSIENAPLLDNERMEFFDTACYWHDLIYKNRMAEANVLQERLSCMKRLPYEKSLIMLCEMLECRLLLEDRNFYCANELLKKYDAALNGEYDGERGTSTDIGYAEGFYLYCYNKASYAYMHREYMEALTFYLRAYNTNDVKFDEKFRLFFNIAACFFEIGQPFHSLHCLDLIKNLNVDDITDETGLHIDNLIVAKYIRIGNLSEAQALSEKCLKRATITGNKTYTGLSLHNFGCIVKEKQDYDKAVEWFDKAFEYFSKNTAMYFENLYQKAFCFYKAKNIAKCKSILPNPKTVKIDKYSILFEALRLMVGKKDDMALCYIENVAIPHLIKIHKKFKALDYCEILESYYKKMDKSKKAMHMAALSRDIYKEIVRGGVFL